MAAKLIRSHGCCSTLVDGYVIRIQVHLYPQAHFNPSHSLSPSPLLHFCPLIIFLLSLLTKHTRADPSQSSWWPCEAFFLRSYLRGQAKHTSSTVEAKRQQWSPEAVECRAAKASECRVARVATSGALRHIVSWAELSWAGALGLWVGMAWLHLRWDVG